MKNPVESRDIAVNTIGIKPDIKITIITLPSLTPSFGLIYLSIVCDLFGPTDTILIGT